MFIRVVFTWLKRNHGMARLHQSHWSWIWTLAQHRTRSGGSVRGRFRTKYPPSPSCSWILHASQPLTCTTGVLVGVDTRHFTFVAAVVLVQLVDRSALCMTLGTSPKPWVLPWYEIVTDMSSHGKYRLKHPITWHTPLKLGCSYSNASQTSHARTCDYPSWHYVGVQVEFD